MSRPNILFLQCDQLTIDVLSMYGRGVADTPHLDRLAARGTVFERTYCNYPLCAPSRASMATGLLASKIGAYDNGAEFPATVPTYAHHLRAMGYRTTLSGKMHFVGPDQHHGFERRLTPDLYPANLTWSPDWEAGTNHDGVTNSRVLIESGICTRTVQLDYDDEVTHRAVAEIHDIARSGETRPFFLQVSWTHPHDPFLCQAEHWDRNPDVPPPRVGLPEDNDPHSARILAQHGFDRGEAGPADIARARRAYCGSVSYIDDQVGHVLAALDRVGLTDSTAVVFTADHGEMLGERGLWLKKTFFEASARVPLIVAAPGRIAAGRVSELCSLVDLLPTFARLADPDWVPEGALDGDDLADLPEGRTILGELTCEGVLAPIFMVCRGRWKYLSSAGDPPILYDLAADPDEQVNVVADHADLVAELEALVQAQWDGAGLRDEVRRAQLRRNLIRSAHGVGAAPDWDRADPPAETRWFRGVGNYNDWALDRLP